MSKVRLDPEWTGRRRIVHATLISCLGLSVYAVSHSAAMAEAVLPNTTTLAGAVVGAYVFGAAWERVRGVGGGNSYEPPYYPPPPMQPSGGAP